MFNKRGQVTIFIIVAIILVATVAGFFIFRGSFEEVTIPANLEPAYNTFLACVEQETSTGISVLESQGGYIRLPEFDPGSRYMPFSSQLNFLGNPIPYWYYVSGNNVQEEQIPSKKDLEEELEWFIEEQISTCNLDELYEGGYTIIVEEDPNADVTVNRESVEVNLDLGLRLEKADSTVLIRKHDVSVGSKLGVLYESAREIYEHEQETLFLENYGVDTLRLYAPVDGVEITCSPKIWSADKVFNELENAIETNVMSLKVENEDLTLRNEEDKYYILDLPVEENVRFLTSSNWSGWSFEVSPTEGSIMKATPVGNQPGLSALGFCYVPYHFVYNVNYPVLVQVYSESAEEVFQFPLAVVIQGNKPREALNATASNVPDPELCKYKNTKMTVGVYDNYLNPISADISFEGFGETCQIGSTDSSGMLNELFPECVNGYIVAEAEGYQTKKKQVESTASSSEIEVIMDKLYDKQVNLRVDGNEYNGEAIITFVSEQDSKTVLYSEENTVELAQGDYEIEVYIYEDASIELESTTTKECMEVPREGIGAFFGLTEEECFDVTIPSQTITNALAGGGKQSYYVSESELQSSSIIDINVKGLPTPKKIEEIQQNYILFENQGADISFK